MELKETENDFTDIEIERINTFVKNGCIGLETLVKDEAKVNGMFSLYMAGKSYVEISKITKVKKDLVLYMSAKTKWYEKRMEYLNDIQKNMVGKLTDTRKESLNFITTLISAHHKYYGERIDKFLETNDRSIIESLDFKQLNQYFKSIEMLEKIINPSNVSSGNKGGATVNVNAPDGAQVRQVDSNTLEITPGTSGDILKELSKLKDAQKKNEN